MQFLRESVISAFLSQIDDFMLIRSMPTGALVFGTMSAHRMSVGIVHTKYCGADSLHWNKHFLREALLLFWSEQLWTVP